MATGVRSLDQSFDSVSVMGILRRLSEDLAGLIAPNEDAFMDLGRMLSSARSMVSAGSDLFREVSTVLTEGQGGDTANTLANAHADTLRITLETRGIGADVLDLEQSVASVLTPLASLGAVIGEIASLGTSAKVQAAHVTATGVDFSVFTKDIDRLRRLADEAARRATEHLEQLQDAVSVARRVTEAFQRDGARELECVGERLRDRLNELDQRRNRAMRLLQDLERRINEIGNCIGHCIAALQINDLTSQRLEHVRAALGVLLGLGDACAESGPQGDHQRRLLAGICDLQVRQLEQAAADFTESVSRLKRNFVAMKRDASMILAESLKGFGGRGDGTTFMDDVYDDLIHAARLLERVCEADDHVRQQIETISQGFGSVGEDLRTILSIDTDMRIMGLNATLKCTRLGPSGLALGVVAQALRGCSHRTEETTKLIVSTIERTSGQLKALGARSECENQAATDLSRRLSQSAEGLELCRSALKAAIRSLHAACGQVGTLIGDAFPGDLLDRRMREGSARVATALKDISRLAAPEGCDPGSVAEEIQRLLGHNYAMASERAVHASFAALDGGKDGMNEGGDDVFFF